MAKSESLVGGGNPFVLFNVKGVAIKLPHSLRRIVFMVTRSNSCHDSQGDKALLVSIRTTPLVVRFALSVFVYSCGLD